MLKERAVETLLHAQVRWEGIPEARRQKIEIICFILILLLVLGVAGAIETH